MLINYDPDRTPNITNKMMEDAKQSGLHPVAIICDELGSKVGDEGGVSFAALVSFIPRQGDRIILEDKRTCEVKRVYYNIVSKKSVEGKAESIMLIPNVTAYIINDES